MSVSVLVLFTGWLVGSADAVPPPNLPLPECRYHDGERLGACDDDDPFVTLIGAGMVGAGDTFGVSIASLVPVCITEVGVRGNWDPGQCYDRIGAISVTCATLDLRDDTFKVDDCSRLLYGGAASPAFSYAGLAYSGTVQGPVEVDTCRGGTGNFRTYAWGGPANPFSSTWVASSPYLLDCDITFDGAEPDSLVGPTWFRVSSWIGVQDYGDLEPEYHPAVTYIPVRGELLDIGPAASFVVDDITRTRVAFRNVSAHGFDQTLRYHWDFGDGTTSTAEHPTHTYRRSGEVEVTLTATDPDGDEDTSTQVVDIDFDIPVEISWDSAAPEVGEPLQLQVEISNPFDDPIERFDLRHVRGLDFDASKLTLIDGPDPAPPDQLTPGERIVMFYTVEPVRPGHIPIGADVQGFLGGLFVTGEDDRSLLVPARVAVTVTTTADALTDIGDTFDVVATLQNREEVTVDDLRVEDLDLGGSVIASVVDGPTSEDGTDPRVVPLSLLPGEPTTVRWTMRAEEPGVATLTVDVSGRDPYDGSLFFVDGSRGIALQTAAIEITALRLAPNAPTPGQFVTLRGTIANIGSVDVTNVRFHFEGSPEPLEIDLPDGDDDPEISPDVDTLVAGDAHDFVVPLVMALEIDDRPQYRTTIRFTADAEYEGESVEIDTQRPLNGGFDVSEYWTSLTAELKRLLFAHLLDAVDHVDHFGDTSPFGAATVGTAEGFIGALQTMGDGTLSAVDLVGYTSGLGEPYLTEQAKMLRDGVATYMETHTRKEMAIALKDVVGTVGSAAVTQVEDWMVEVHVATQAGDVREVARLLSEPGTEIAAGITSGQAMAKILAKVGPAKLLSKARASAKKRRRAPDPVDEVDVDAPAYHAADLEDVTDMPTGVPITGQTVARLGITIDEQAWMVKIAKRYGVAFFVRPRPPSARKFAERLFNAKPLKIKAKSIGDLDRDWLGFDDVRVAGVDDTRGLVAIRDPKNPLEALKEAAERGDIKEDGPEWARVLKRYNLRKGEFEAWKKDFDPNEVIEVKRFGKTVKTKVVWDEDSGLLTFDHNKLPIYSDVDLMLIGWPDGTMLPKWLHDRISKAAGAGFDSQHGDTFATADFRDWENAVSNVRDNGALHQRGGEGGPLAVIQADHTSLAYVDTFEFPESVPGSGGDLYGKVKARFEGTALWANGAK